MVELATALNLGEMQRYLNRVGDRWPLQVVMLGGARVDDARGAPPQRERGPEFIVVLVSRAFEGMPWLERVYQATSLWDGMAWRGSRRCSSGRRASWTASGSVASPSSMAAWRMIAPVSTPSSTTNSVAPVTLTP